MSQFASMETRDATFKGERKPEHARDPAYLRVELDQAIGVDGGHRSRDGVSHSCMRSHQDLDSKDPAIKDLRS